MAGRGLRHVHRLFAAGGDGGGPTGFAAGDEFDESDVWGLAPDPRPAESRKLAPPSRAARKKPEKSDRASSAAAAASLPVSIPDWSKILRQEYRGNANANVFVEEEEEEAGTGVVIPPHELLWRTRAASFSVHEGIGRTLKGRDLSRVRDAVWEQTGFEA